VILLKLIGKGLIDSDPAFCLVASVEFHGSGRFDHASLDLDGGSPSSGLLGDANQIISCFGLRTQLNRRANH
jgi:hypothetical protein